MSRETPAAILWARGIVKGYRTTAGYVPVLQDLDLSLSEGEMLAITGTSGVGKSTLLHVLGTLDRPEAGELQVAGESVLEWSEQRLREYRNRTLGFVFQFHHLLPEFNAVENVMMPLLIARQSERDAKGRALELLARLGLAERATHRPGALSGGEQQRVAVARALACGPKVLLADEPTGNLDRESSDRLHEWLRRLNQGDGLTVLVVTHNDRLAAACDRQLRLDQGRLVEA